MMNTSFYTSMIASQLAAQHMSFGGLLLFTGAAAALDPTPDMIGYGAAKAAVHHLSQSVAKAYYPRFDTVVICPGTLNTEANRTVRSPFVSISSP
jgi:dihydropteridine reductase